MKTKTKGIIGIVGLAVIGVMAILYFVQTNAFMTKIGEIAAQEIGARLEVPVKIGAVEIDSPHTLRVRDLAIYDRQAEPIVSAREAEIKFGLFAVLRDNPLDAVSEINLKQVDANLTYRADNSWNVQDLVKEESQDTPFHAAINVTDSNLHLKYGDAELTLEDIQAQADFAGYPAVKIAGTARNQGADFRVNGALGSERQVLRLAAGNIDAKNYLPFLPAEILPAEVKVLGAQIEQANVSVAKHFDDLTLCGEAKYSDGQVQVVDTLVEDIKGSVFFTEKNALLSVDATANEQTAHVQGNIRWDTPSPYADLRVTADSFDPGRIITGMPWQGAAQFVADVRGTFDSPVVTGEFKVASGTAADVPFQNAECSAQMENNTVTLKSFAAELMGGKVNGEGKLRLDDLSYVIHVKPTGINVAAVRQYAPELALNGLIDADIGINGRGFDLTDVQTYGTAKLTEGSWQNVPIKLVTTSFYSRGKTVTLDHLTAKFAQKSSFGAEGKIIDGKELDLEISGISDLALAGQIAPQADVTGWGVFNGRVQGDFANPYVHLTFTGRKGKLFKQPFDTLKTEIAGTLDKIAVKDFYMEKDAKEVWQVKGEVGVIGEKRLNLQVDTMGARLEDVVALVPTDQVLTGSFDNIIKLSGTLDRPEAVGYIHMYRGSYNGMLLSGMDGDYTINGDEVTLQDFHIFSPMIDMDVNGTINTGTRALAMQAVVHDIDAERFKHKFPYELSGHGTFIGDIGGTLDMPNFDGTLKMPKLTLNGYDIRDLKGEITFVGGVFAIKGAGFKQNGGEYNLRLTADTQKDFLNGRLDLVGADVGFLLAALDKKNDIVEGTLNSQVDIGGALTKPVVVVTGAIPHGKLVGYDLHDAELKLRYADSRLYINRFSGHQGDAGVISADGCLDLQGSATDAKLTATNFNVGMFAKLAGLDVNAVGTTDITAHLGGSMENPTADMQVSVSDGGIRGSTFDSLKGDLRLVDGMVELKSLNVQKQVLANHYQASAKGVIPLGAIFGGDVNQLDDSKQMKLILSLDDANLSLLPILSPQIEWAQGETDGNVEITGTLANPELHGQFAVVGGAMKIKNIHTPVEDMRVQLDFDGRNIDLTECSGRMGQGTYSLQGSTVLQGVMPTAYNFNLVADHLDVQSEFFKGPITAEFSLNEQTMDFMRRQVKMPMLKGKLMLENILLSLPTLPESESEMPHILLDVTLELGKKVRFYSPFIGNMLFTGSAHFGGSARHPKPSGTISVVRGSTINYMKSAVFKIEEGEAHFNQVDSFLPSIDFRAQTRVGHTKIYLNVNGPLGQEIKFNLSSSPEMSQTEILQVLTTRSEARNGNNITTSDVLAMGLQMAVLSELENRTRNIFDFDVLSATKGSSSLYNRELDEDTYNLQLGKYISDKVMLRYAQDFGHSHLTRVGIQYDFDDRFSALVDHEGSRFVYGLEAKIKF